MSRLPKDQVHKMAQEAAGKNIQARSDAKRYLSRIIHLQQDIKRRDEEVNQLRMDAVGNGAMRYDAVKVQTSTSGDTMAKAVAHYVDLETEVMEERVRLADMRHEIIGQINGIESENYANLLFKRYVENKSLELIAVEMNFTYEYVRRMHGRALQAFGEKYAGEIEKATQSYTDLW